MADIAVPFKVSPFIRFSRWSLLLLGVGYGAMRNRSLSKKEAAIREIEVKQKAIRDAKLAEEKARLSKLELDNLAKMAGVPPEP